MTSAVKYRRQYDSQEVGLLCCYCTISIPNCQSMTKMELAQEEFNGLSQNGGSRKILLKPPRLSPFNKELSNYTVFSQIYLDGQYL
jgi:hypothetical protein